MALRHNKKIRSIEQLESRQVMAGNVFASVDAGGNLLIRGDIAANSMTLTQIAAGAFDLIGHDTLGDIATRINSVDNGTAHLTGVTGTITIIGNGGDDAIEVSYINHNGSLIINSGEGNDTVTLGSSAAPSYLTGSLSIRTQEGADVVTENKFNVSGFQDYAAAQTDGTTNAGNVQSFTVVSSTFGSSFAVNFGAHAAELNLQNVTLGGAFKVFDQVPPALQNNVVVAVPPQVAQNFVMQLDTVSAGNTVEVNSTLTSTINLNNVVCLNTFSITTLGSTNSLTVANSRFFSLTNQTKKLFSYSQTNVANTTVTRTRFVESTNDTVSLSNTTVSSQLRLQSSGSITVQNSALANTYLNAYNNAHASITTDHSTFVNLTLALGSLNGIGYLQGDVAASNSGAQTSTATVADCQVSGTLSIDGTTRAKRYSAINGATLISGVVLNRSAAVFNINRSTINHFKLPAVFDTPPVGSTTVLGGNGGRMTVNSLSSTFHDVNLNFIRSDDNVNFTNSFVSAAIALEGGFGTNVFRNVNSLLHNLTLSHFA